MNLRFPGDEDVQKFEKLFDSAQCESAQSLTPRSVS